MCHSPTEFSWQFVYFEEFYPVVVAVFNKDETVLVTSSDGMVTESVPLLTFIFIYCTLYMDKPNFWIYIFFTRRWYTRPSSWKIQFEYT